MKRPNIRDAGGILRGHNTETRDREPIIEARAEGDGAKRLFTELESRLSRGANRHHVAYALFGIDTPESMVMRRRLVEIDPDLIFAVTQGLVGVDSDESIAFRRELLQRGASPSNIASSLAGVDTPESFQLRRELLNKDFPSMISLAHGVCGTQSQDSMDFRRKLIEKGAEPDHILLSLTGVATVGSYEMRNELMNNGGGKQSLAMSLAGIDTKQAEAIRQELLLEGVIKAIMLQSYLGVDSKEAREYRESFGESDTTTKISGLTGIASPHSMELRERAMQKGVSPHIVAHSLAGILTPESFAFRDKHFSGDDDLYVNSFVNDSVVDMAIICKVNSKKK